MSAKDLAQRLAQDAEGIAKMLLPNGKRVGSEWECGSINGEEGKSCKVHLTGNKAGVWCDFSSNESGDLLDLWALTKGVSIGDAIKEVRAYLGINAVEFSGTTRKTFRVPSKPSMQYAAGRVLAYLRTRGITDETITAYRVRSNKDDSEIVFPYLTNGRLRNIKYRKPGDKAQLKAQGIIPFRVEKDCEPCLFGWQAIDEKTRKITICEGEIDALTLYQYGYPALSVFSGAGNHTWIENEFENLERFDEIYLCFDNDEPGKKGAREIAERLGRARCRMVSLPRKDANECLTQGISKEEIDACFRKAITLDPSELKSAKDYLDAVIKEFYPPAGHIVGFNPPWPSLHGKLRFRPGEYIVLNGTNGHGKSQLAGHIVLDALAQDQLVCVASLEMKPRKWLRRLDRQATALEEPSIEYLKAVHDWYHSHLWVFDATGKTDGQRIIDTFVYARQRYGVKVFVIDNLAMCGYGHDDYNAQKEFVLELCTFKNDYDTTVFLITHPRKTESENKMNDKFDVGGAGTITDLADTFLDVWRNKPKEDKAARGEDVSDMPDAILSCKKQREGDWEGRKGLWFDKKSYQFLEHPKLKARPYVHYSRLEAA